MPEDTDLTAAPEPAAAYTHPDKRKNLPLSGMPMKNKVKEQPKHRYEYDPHLPPVLRFDSSEASKNADQLPELLRAAQQRALRGDEIALLAEALRNREPWLEWAGKREAKACEVDPVALHIHERVSAQAILKVAARQDVTRNLFADPEQEYREAVDFYQHEVDWSNRLILGDSLEVMASLAKREDLSGKVQCIYMDPPYGIKYGSNFQSEVGKKDVGDRPEDLTREAEMVKAYRDTWNLGVHSYLTYLRDRFYAAKDMLSDTGSIFIQISDENVQRVRLVLDEVFGPENQVATVAYKKPAPQTKTIKKGFNYLLWYCRDISVVKVRKLFNPRAISDGTTEDPRKLALWLQMPNGFKRTLTTEEKREEIELPDSALIFRADKVRDTASNDEKIFKFPFQGEDLMPGQGFSWRGNPQEMERLRKADRLLRTDESLAYKLFLNDNGGVEITSLWDDTAGKIPDMRYVVQTNEKLPSRCILMTTDPGDLVLDPTCGSGTTAFVAEQWGRRWISIDSSRVALAIARQRLLTAKFDYYPLFDHEKGVSGGFVYQTIPHIKLKNIAQNMGLDPLFEKWEIVLTEKLATLNHSLSGVTSEIRRSLTVKLEMKRRKKDKSDPVTDADIRRWVLPEVDKGWQEWEVPFDTDPDWPETLRDALTSYRVSWQARMDEVNAAIAARADQEKLVDQPRVDTRKLRVSGPFTIEGVIPAAESLNFEDSPIGGEPEELETFEPQEDTTVIEETSNAEAYLDKMLRLLKSDGVRFSDNKVLQFTELRPLSGSTIHAAGTWGEDGDERRVGISFGPQHGPITSMQVVEVLHLAYRRGYDEIVFAGFSFDASAQATIQENQDDPDANIQAHICHIRPDASPSMSGLLKDSPKSAKPAQHNQIFTVSGLPRARVTKEPDGQFVARMEGVDIYDPVANTVYTTGAEKVAAWFLDSDYDGKAFCITQAFFPDAKAWDKLSKALTGVVDPDRFAAFSGTKSLPFPVGKHKRAAVKVIDPRGNEVMKVLSLEGVSYGA